MLKNETDSQAESQHKEGFSKVIIYEIQLKASVEILEANSFSMVIIYETQLKASVEILEANYHEVYRYGEESCLLGPEWITITDYKLPENFVFYLIVLRQGLTYLRVVLNSLYPRITLNFWSWYLYFLSAGEVSTTTLSGTHVLGDGTHGFVLEKHSTNLAKP